MNNNMNGYYLTRVSLLHVASENLRNPGMAVKSAVISKLTSRFKPSSLLVIDESSQHRGHAAMKGLNAEETHFSVDIVSSEFSGISKLQRQRLVFSALADEMSASIHALRMTCRAPDDP